MERLRAVKALRYISPDWGQMDYYPEHPPVKYPCALIDIQGATYTNLGERIQQGEATVSIRLFDLMLTPSSHPAPQSIKDNAARFRQLMEDVNKTLHGKALSGTAGKPVRASMNKVKRADGCYEVEILYRIPFTDATCYPERVGVTPALKISV